MGLAYALQCLASMMPLLVAPAANDLPEPKNTDRARERTRDRRLRGPNWSAPVREVKSA